MSSPSPYAADLLRLLGHEPQYRASPKVPSRERAFSPNFDVAETETAYILEGEFAGLHDKSQISIELTDNQTLSIHGTVSRSSHDTHKPTVEEVPDEEDKVTEKKEETKKESKVKYWVSERSVGRFQRQFSFPSMIEVDGIEAKLEDGLLRVVVPKQVQRGVKKIRVL